MNNSSKSSTAQETRPTVEMEGKRSLLGFRMPAEWEPHAGCWMGWPERPDNWRESAVHAQKVFAKVATAISNYEPVTVCASAAQWDNARSLLPSHVRIIETSMNDSWFHDTDPHSTSREEGTRQAASYVNFYIAYGAIIAPSFGDEKYDKKALNILSSVFADYEVILIEAAREICLGGGNIHCITQQQPSIPFHDPN